MAGLVGGFEGFFFVVFGGFFVVIIGEFLGSFLWDCYGEYWRI